MVDVLAVHSSGLLRVNPKMLSSLRSLLLILMGASLRPVPSQKMHVSPPRCAHAGHGSGSPLSPRPTASPPNTTAVASTVSFCAASSSSGDGTAAVTVSIPRRCRHPRCPRLTPTLLRPSPIKSASRHVTALAPPVPLLTATPARVFNKRGRCRVIVVVVVASFLLPCRRLWVRGETGGRPVEDA